MTHKNATRHYANAYDKSIHRSSRGQLVQMVIDLRHQLGEQRAKADREIELVVIHRNTAERERAVVTQVNHQLLMQINVLREA